MRFKSTEETSNKKLSLATLSLRRRSQLTRSSRTLKLYTLSVPLKVTDLLESLRDSEPENYQERFIEVLERLVVLDLDIHPESNRPLPDVVNLVTIRELR